MGRWLGKVPVVLNKLLRKRVTKDFVFEFSLRVPFKKVSI